MGAEIWASVLGAVIAAIAGVVVSFLTYKFNKRLQRPPSENENVENPPSTPMPPPPPPPPPFPSPPLPPSNELNAIGKNMCSGSILCNGQCLENGKYRFIMQSDGNLVLYDNSRVVWASGTYGKGSGCELHLETTGELVIYDTGTLVWQSGAVGPVGDYILSLLEDRNVVVSKDGLLTWATNTSISWYKTREGGASANELTSGSILRNGQSLRNGNYEFIMQSDGNLVLYGHHKFLWSSRTCGKGCRCDLHFETTGGLAIYYSGNTETPVWRSGKAGLVGNYTLCLKEDGNLSVYKDGRHAWVIYKPRES